MSGSIVLLLCISSVTSMTIEVTSKGSVMRRAQNGQTSSGKEDKVMQNHTQEDDVTLLDDQHAPFRRPALSKDEWLLKACRSEKDVQNEKCSEYTSCKSAQSECQRRAGVAQRAKCFDEICYAEFTTEVDEAVKIFRACQSTARSANSVPMWRKCSPSLRNSIESARKKYAAACSKMNGTSPLPQYAECLCTKDQACSEAFDTTNKCMRQAEKKRMSCIKEAREEGKTCMKEIEEQKRICSCNKVMSDCKTIRRLARRANCFDEELASQYIKQVENEPERKQHLQKEYKEMCDKKGNKQRPPRSYMRCYRKRCNFTANSDNFIANRDLCNSARKAEKECFNEVCSRASP